MVTKINESYNDIELDEDLSGLHTPSNLKKALKALKSLNQCVSTLSGFQNNDWYDKKEVMPLLKDASESLSGLINNYRVLMQGV